MMQTKSVLVTLLLTVLISITIAASDRRNVRSVNLSARYINGERALVESRQMVETAGTTGVDKTEDDDGATDDENGDDDGDDDAFDDDVMKNTKRQGGSNSTSADSVFRGKGSKESKYSGPSKKSKKMSSKDDNRLKASKRGSAPTNTPGSPTTETPTHSPDDSAASPADGLPDDSPTVSPEGSSPTTASTEAPANSPSTSTEAPASSPSNPTEAPGGNDGDAPVASPDGDDGTNGTDDDAANDQTDGASTQSVEVPADTFRLFYTLAESRLPSTEEFQELAQITSTYLEEYMRGAFGDGLEIFSTFMIFQEFRIDQPARCDYRSVGTFKGDFDDIPSTADLNNMIASAFSGPNLQGYLARLGSLPGGNVFQTTTEVGQEAEAQSESDSSSSGAAAAAGAGALILLAGAAHVARRKQKKQQGESDADDADKLNGEGSDAGTIGAEGDESTADASH